MADLKPIYMATAHLQLTANIIFTNPGPFAAEGLEVRMVCPGSGIPIAQMVLNGRAEYNNVLALPIQWAVEGRPLKFVASYQNSGWELWTAPSIRTFADLQGKPVGRSSPMARKYLDMALRQNGIDPETVPHGQRVNLDYTAITDILTGRVAGATFMPPVTAMAKHAGLTCLAKLGDFGDPVAFGLMTSDAHLKKNRDEVRSVIRAMLNSVEMLKGDRNLARRLVRDQGVSEDYVDITIDQTLPQLNSHGRLDQASQHQWISFGRELAGLKQEVPLSQVFDFSVLDEVSPAKAIPKSAKAR